MRIYRVDFDVSTYQTLELAEGHPSHLLCFEGRAKQDWQAPTVYVDNPLLPEPDLWFPGNCTSVAFQARKLPLDVIGHLEEAGQWLPIKVEDRPEMTVLNVTQIVNGLDKDRCLWVTNPQGRRLFLQNVPGAYAFHPERFGESSLCKLPDFHGVDILCIERSGHPKEEFKAAVEHHGLKGLEFKLLWEG